MKKKYTVYISISFIFILLLLFSFPNQSDILKTTTLRSGSPISIQNIEIFVIEQLDLGPRIPGSNGSFAFKDWVFNKIPSGWLTIIKNFTYRGIELRNYWITTSNSTMPKFIIGAHYDTRARADQDNQFPNDPVAGANDGGSGVAGIIELISHIPLSIASNIGFVLFDGEDQGSGGMPTWDWIVGSTEFAKNLSTNDVNQLEGFILFDMIGDDSLQLPWEKNSDKNLINEIWGLASKLGYGSIFVNNSGYSLIDDHIPFIQKGIPSIDIIDFDYPEWHTTKDEINSIDSENIAIVVDVILYWLLLKFQEEFSNTTSHTSSISTYSNTTSQSSNSQDFSSQDKQQSNSLISTQSFLSFHNNTNSMILLLLFIKIKKKINSY